ncbi:hypothetical protein PF008_g15914 [Phytophthora fragariae]|uniref:Uncharacterized protein n=1 Tax=Phytophthora fragariae TaxID=53985 RepID=A0A6G0RE16_9STRA|nr:hypothetical protein PF008_g15914 [Phytophthora fragariae]
MGVSACVGTLDTSSIPSFVARGTSDTSTAAVAGARIADSPNATILVAPDVSAASTVARAVTSSGTLNRHGLVATATVGATISSPHSSVSWGSAESFDSVVFNSSTALTGLAAAVISAACAPSPVWRRSSSPAL